jgi:hypothetical protein
MARWVPRRIGQLEMLVLSLCQMHGLSQPIVGLGRLLAVLVSATIVGNELSQSSMENCDSF